MAARAAALDQHPHVGEVRQRGMILAIECLRDKAAREPWPWQERRGRLAYRHALARGVLLRPLGETIYCMPPYVLGEAEVDLMIDVAAECVDVIARG
jgi:adenosylmethionine-8-amino-7-oxononanoate aminotransferase